ncbi:MAG TPA: pitrilysin family protein [Microbacteriaceae bacterium]|nr:pitrilysin family protein [Microbacteriaceae bacterium]
MSSSVILDLSTPELSIACDGGTLVRRTVHPSGLRILSEQVPGAQSVSVGFWVPVGSRDEAASTATAPSTFGSTHFLEHLLFKGTRTRTALDIAVAFDEVGGEHNALTAKEHTCYYAKVQGADLAMAVDVLADMVADSIIDADEFATERNVILEELAMADDDPADVAHERFFEALLADHPLGRPIGGTPETIRAVDRDAVWEHYQRWYRPETLVVTVAGAVDHDELVELVGASLTRAGWNLDQHATPVERRATVAAPKRVAPVSVITRPLEQVNLFVGTPALVATDPRRFVTSILNAVLGSGMSSRLFQEIREKRGLAYSVNSFANGYSDAGAFGMYAGCSAEATPKVLALMLDELDRMASDGITEAEHRRALGQLRGASALALEDSDTRMSRLGRSEIGSGEFLDFGAALERLRAVSRDDVQQLAGEFAAGAFTASAVGPVSELSHAKLARG